MAGFQFGFGLGLSSNTGGTAKPAWQSRGIVTNRLSLPLNQFGVNGDASSMMLQEQSDFLACQDFTNGSLVWQNLSVQTSDEKGENTFTVKASIFNSTGSYGTISGRQPITFSGGTESGRRSPAIVPGGIVESAVSAFASNKGTRILVRRELTATAAFTRWPTNEYPRFVGDDVSRKGNSLDTGYVDSGDPAGGFYDNTNAPNANVHGAPAAIIGDTTTRVARIAILNDSQGAGSGDSQSSETTMGWIATWLGSNFPSVRIGNGGYSLASFMADATKRAQRLSLMSRCGITHLLVELGTNDCEGGTGGATFMSNLAALLAELAASSDPVLKAIRVIPCTLTPRTNAGNTAPTANNATRLSTNASIIAANGCGFGCIDVAALTFASGGTSLWSTTGGRGTGDGVHPNAATHAYIAANLPAPSTIFTVGHFA